MELFNFSEAIAVAVYTGSSVGTLKLVGDSRTCTPNITADDAGDGAGPCVWLTASPNTTYRIAVVPSSDPSSGFHLSVGGRPCSVRGTRGTDVLEVTPALDVVCGFGGNDVIHADGPLDTWGDEYERQEDVILGGLGRTGLTTPTLRVQCSLSWSVE